MAKGDAACLLCSVHTTQSPNTPIQHLRDCQGRQAGNILRDEWDWEVPKAGHAYNLSMQEAETGGLWTGDQPALHNYTAGQSKPSNKTLSGRRGEEKEEEDGERELREERE